MLRVAAVNTAAECPTEVDVSFDSAEPFVRDRRQC